MTLLARLEISKMYLRDEQNGTGWINSTGDCYMLFVHVNVKDPFSPIYSVMSIKGLSILTG